MVQESQPVHLQVSSHCRLFLSLAVHLSTTNRHPPSSMPFLRPTWIFQGPTQQPRGAWVQTQRHIEWCPQARSVVTKVNTLRFSICDSKLTTLIKRQICKAIDNGIRNAYKYPMPRFVRPAFPRSLHALITTTMHKNRYSLEITSNAQPAVI